MYKKPNYHCGFFRLYFDICAHRMNTRNWRLLLLLLELHNLLEKAEEGEDLRGLYGVRFLADGMHNTEFLFVNKCEICVRNHKWKYLPQSISIFSLTFCVVFFWAHCKDPADFTISCFIFLPKCQHLSQQLVYQQNTVWDFPFPDISASEFLIMNVTVQLPTFCRAHE